MTSALDLVSLAKARGALFLSLVTFLAGGEENDRILVVRLLRLFFTAKKNKVLLCDSGVEFAREAKKLSDV